MQSFRYSSDAKLLKHPVNATYFCRNLHKKKLIILSRRHDGRKASTGGTMCENTKEPLPLREAAPEIFKKSTYVGLVLIKVYALERYNHEATLSFFEVLANGEVSVFDELLFHQA